MTRSMLTVTALLVLAQVAGAQVPGAAAKAAAKSAVAATNEHVAIQQGVAVEKSAKPASSKTVERPATRADFPGVDTTGTPPVIMRETYGYTRDGRRDPFVSLLTTSELRPTMSDLRLTGILYDQAGGHSVATLRDVGTNASYKVTAGSTLGRMRVSSIRLKTVVFTIDEFGMSRQDSLVLGDSTKVRVK